MNTIPMNKKLAIAVAIFSVVCFSQAISAKSMTKKSSGFDMSLAYGVLNPSSTRVDYDGMVILIYPPPTRTLIKANFVDLSYVNRQCGCGLMVSMTADTAYMDYNLGSNTLGWDFQGVYLTLRQPVGSFLKVRAAGGWIGQELAFLGNPKKKESGFGARADVIGSYKLSKSLALYGSLAYLHFKEYKGVPGGGFGGGNYTFNYSGTAATLGIKYEL